MTHEEHSGTFAYTYSAKQQEEVRRIRDKYTDRQESKLEQLRRLDQSVTRKGMPAALTLGICSCLVLGVGMSCCLVWDERLFVPGIGDWAGGNCRHVPGLPAVQPYHPPGAGAAGAGDSQADGRADGPVKKYGRGKGLRPRILPGPEAFVTKGSP